ncbi:FAD-dependent oxidoreductase [Amycolatopsis cihanbeyliensis]|uniref:Flavin-dependent amine oxidoreductase n=1 Tax=Amycolatopsis cihanbeyliensis TaxID=1128664 RepID=A0A542CSX0_AMYCI|nr:FAD-dependent oxidoreductase [Amycolatopsis cihanbeyliensis]TQI93919.1 flavin-dependent amine oxidoreductase [Amycolatopsis cihanbeyliensis]
MGLPGTRRLDTVSLDEWLALHEVAGRGRELTAALVEGFATRPLDELSAAHAAWWIAAAGGLVAVPLPALRQLALSPPPSSAFRSAMHAMTYGRASKIVATVTGDPPVRHRAVLGAGPLAIAWRHGSTLAGIGITDDTAPAALASDLATAFGLDPAQLNHSACTNWTEHPHIGGSHLVHTPGQLTQHAAALRYADRRARVRYAGADFSGWPNSMEGAVRSGQAAATGLVSSRRAGWAR